MITTKLAEFIAGTNAASTSKEVLDFLVPQANIYGCEYVAFAPATPAAVNSMIDVNPDMPYIVNYPADWVKIYQERNYNDIDPVFKYAAVSLEGFSWKLLKHDPDMTAEVRKFWSESEKYGLACGATIPIHCPGDRTFTLSLSSSNMVQCKLCMLMAELQIVAYQFTIAYLNSHKPKLPIPDNPLSRREREVLFWSAQGKSAWEISVILGISEHTVTFHVKNSISKLDATNKVAAVVKALRFGFISLLT